MNVSTACVSERVTNQSPCIEVRVPASTSNFGSGFDCCGLALQLYLTVRAYPLTQSNSQELTTQDTAQGFTEVGGAHGCSDNLILKAMRFVAEREGFQLPSARLVMHNEIPLASGLGSSGAAIIAGLKLGAALGSQELSTSTLLRYANQLEGHADNVAAALLGGWVVHCINEDGSVYAIKRPWPSDIKVMIVSPHVMLSTASARKVLPLTVSRADAVHNMQRIALFNAALENRAYELLWEAMRDRIHHPHRQSLVPGLGEALAIPRRDGLLGLALSGAGPSILALASNPANGVGEEIADCFRQHGIAATIRHLEIDNDGAQLTSQTELPLRGCLRVGHRGSC